MSQLSLGTSQKDSGIQTSLQNMNSQGDFMRCFVNANS